MGYIIPLPTHNGGGIKQAITFLIPKPAKILVDMPTQSLYVLPRVRPASLPRLGGAPRVGESSWWIAPGGDLVFLPGVIPMPKKIMHFSDPDGVAGKEIPVRAGRPRKPVPGQRKARKDRGLSPIHHRVLEWYFHPSINFNKRQALLKAGYSNSTASTQAKAIFDREDVKKAIKERLEQESGRFKIDRKWISDHLALLATANTAGILAKLKENGYDLNCLSPEEQYQLAELKERNFMEGRGEDAKPVVEIAVKGENRTAALQSLAKLHGLNEEKPADGTLSIVDILAAGRNRIKKGVT